jgi:Type I phosphodiesterase / nucleotide pyrophosphatase
MRRTMLLAALGFALLPGLLATAPAEGGEHGGMQRVLLISIDGLHALDVANYVAAHPHSALAELSDDGLTFTNARTPANSDSFPGLLALVTGGSPRTHGLFYDYSYDRTIWPPDHGGCNGPSGTQMIFDESIDVYVNNVSQNVIDPNALPFYRDPEGNCVRMYPHNALRVNTLFEVIRAEHAGRTAWADKHPAYDLVNGPSGKGVDDLYTPEITNAPGFDNTISVVCTADNDALKVKAVLNEIHGLNHEGTKRVGVPTVFGLDFQAVSVGQKLLLDNPGGPAGGGCPNDTDPSINQQKGGYLDGSGAPSKVLDYGLKRTDDALRQFIDALKSQGLYDSTLIIVTSKHGQSPINFAKLVKPGHFADLVCTVPDASACTTNEAAKIITDAGNNCPEGPCGWVQDDDVGLIWLPDQSKTKLVTDYLNKYAPALFIDEVMSREDLKLKFNDPLHDSRTPDIIVQPVYGTIYTGANKNKLAEHGGFSFGDTNVGLIVSNPGLRHRVVKTPVLTSQVAATILKSLDIDPNELQAVRKEGIQVLPFVFSGHGELD